MHDEVSRGRRRTKNNITKQNSTYNIDTTKNIQQTTSPK
jgi:hypothetical protein